MKNVFLAIANQCPSPRLWYTEKASIENLKVQVVLEPDRGHHTYMLILVFRDFSNLQGEAKEDEPQTGTNMHRFQTKSSNYFKFFYIKNSGW